MYIKIGISSWNKKHWDLAMGLSPKKKWLPWAIGFWFWLAKWWNDGENDDDKLFVVEFGVPDL